MSLIELTYTTDLYVSVDTETGKVVKVEVNTQDPALSDLIPEVVADGSSNPIARDDERAVKAIEIAEKGNWIPFRQWEGYPR